MYTEFHRHICKLCGAKRDCSFPECRGLKVLECTGCMEILRTSEASGTLVEFVDARLTLAGAQ